MASSVQTGTMTEPDASTTMTETTPTPSSRPTGTQTTVASEGNKEPIHSIYLSSKQVGQYELLEISFQVNSTYKNPFDPSQVDITAVFTTPSGKTVTYPAFYTRNNRDILKDFVPDKEGVSDYGKVTVDFENIYTTAYDYWAVRFSWNEIGKYRFEIRMKDANGVYACEGPDFTVTQTDAVGPVVVSPKNSQFLVYRDSGKQYIPVGINACMAQDTSTFIKVIKGIAENGGNHTRIWCNTDFAYGSLGFENWYQGAGWYNLDRAAAMDRVLNYARSQNVGVEVTFDSFTSLNTSKQFYGEFPSMSIYSTMNGGFLDNAKDFWKDENSKRLFKNRLRYGVARWGWDTNIVMWELMNEIDGCEGYFKQLDTIGSAWVSEMAAYLKSIDPYQRLVSLSAANDLSNHPRTFVSTSLSVAEPHVYDRSDMAEAIADLTKDGLQTAQRVLVSEFGLVGIEEGKVKDPEYDSMHIGLWAGIHSGGLGAPMYWFWNGVIDSGNIKHLYPISQYVQAFDFVSEKLVSAKIQSSAGLKAMGLTTQSGTRSMVWVYNEAYTWTNPNPKMVSAGSVELKNLIPGRYQVQIWNTWEGTVSQTKETTVKADGVLKMDLGAVPKDVAMIVQKK